MSLMDEPDFEVTDLRTGLPDERVYAHDDERKKRRRRLGAVVTVLALLAVLVLPFISVPGFGATVRQALRLPSPTPAPSLALGGDIIYFEHGLPWGTLLMDGKLVTNVGDRAALYRFRGALHVLSHPLWAPSAGISRPTLPDAALLDQHSRGTERYLSVGA